ncbi:MAG: molybdopterin-dependent oxidoreductase [Tepidisphaerales bacterium]
MTMLASAPPLAAKATGALVNITINGQKIQATLGQTVLQAATTAGIIIPTLCHHPAVKPYGGCRMCVVEIQKQRGLQPSCTFPVAEGLVIQTETPRVVEARKFVLEMLFSERIHYCMFCTISGGEHTSDCELQRLAYRYGLTNWKYAPNTNVRWPVDATRGNFIMDHSRCILCRRCVRACDELAASHTLGVRERGTRTMICADDGVPFAESSCVKCGTCMQVCPTGALFDRRSAYCGHEADIQRTRSTCMACGVGCPIETVTRNNRVLRVEGVWEADNAGVLCEEGRFKILDEAGPRVDMPLIRRNGTATECSWDEALTYVAGRLNKTKKIAGLITTKSTNESLVAFSRMFDDLFRSDQVSLLSGKVPPLDIGEPGNFADLQMADLIIVIGGDPWQEQKTLAYLTRRAIERGARLIVANAEPTGLEAYADVVIRLMAEPANGKDPHAALGKIYHLRPERILQVKQGIDAAQHPVVMYGPGLDDEIFKTLRTLPSKTRFLPLITGPNIVGASLLGLDLRPVTGEALYVVASDEIPNGTDLPKADFTLVQSCYHNRWTDQADVVLPSKIWYEKQGHITNFEGKRMMLTRSVDAPTDILSDWATMFMLSVKMGRPLTCITVADSLSGLV